MSMKIGIDASRYSHKQATGVELYSHHIIDGVVSEIGKNKQDTAVLYSRSRISGDRGKFVNKVVKNRRFWTLLGLSREMIKNKPDCLFVPSHVLPFFGPRNSVITIHDVAFKHLRSSYSFLQYHYLNWSTKYAVKHASKIIVPSEATADDLKFFYNCPNSKIEVIPHGFQRPEGMGARAKPFELPVFKYFGINEKTKYFLFIGRLESKKNLDRVVRAFAIFMKNNKNFKLVLAGKRGVGFNCINKLVENMDLNHCVIMPGYITEDEKQALYENCQAFIFPSLYEGFGLPILEAFYYKKPVLTSQVSSLPEVASDAAFYVDPGSIEEIAAGMEKLANDKKYVSKIVKLGTKRLQNFSWSKAAKKTYKVLKNG